MATVDTGLDRLGPENEASHELAISWRRLTRAATIVAVLTAPALFVWFTKQNGWDWWVALLATIGVIAVFRGIADLLFRKLIPRPSLFGLDSPQLLEEDVVARRRAWFWRFWFRLGSIFFVSVTAVWLFRGGSWWGTVQDLVAGLGAVLSNPLLWTQVFFVFFLFLANFGILFGPLLLMNSRRSRPSSRVTRSGASSWRTSAARWRRRRRSAGSSRSGSRGSSSSARAASVNAACSSTAHRARARRCWRRRSPPASTRRSCPSRARALLRRSSGSTRSWCATWPGRRSASPASGAGSASSSSTRSTRSACAGRRSDRVVARAPRPPVAADGGGVHFYGAWGALNPSGDLVLETREWRERLFAERQEHAIGLNGFQTSIMRLYNFMFPGMGGGMGSLALNQLLVVMDGIDNPPFFRRFWTNRVNTLLDGIYVVPRRVNGRSLRLPAPRPRREQVYFIGATNVPLNQLDPALIRPGRMGRHVWFRTPTKHDRLDILDLYIGKVSHDADLDSPRRRDEIARITNGYSPAMIEQVTSMALTIAHHSGRDRFQWEDLVESITTIETGTAVGIDMCRRRAAQPPSTRRGTRSQATRT